ncbi:MAG: hypothetical protein ACPGUD_04650 [Parashewanella sp.]
MDLKIIALTFISLILVTACNNEEKRQQPSSSIRLIAHDTYLQNTKVCSDCNNNLQCDSNESFAFTDHQGVVTKSDLNQNCSLLADVTANSSYSKNQQPARQKYKLTSPKNCQIISPMTTMLHHKMYLGSSIQQAKQDLHEELLTDVDFCDNFLEASKNKDSTAISRIEAEAYTKISKDYPSEYASASQEISQDEALKKLSHQQKHHLAIHDFYIKLNRYTANINVTPVTASPQVATLAAAPSTSEAQDYKAPKKEQHKILALVDKAKLFDMPKYFNTDISKEKLFAFQHASRGLAHSSYRIPYLPEVTKIQTTFKSASDKTSQSYFGQIFKRYGLVTPNQVNELLPFTVILPRENKGLNFSNNGLDTFSETTSATQFSLAGLPMASLMSVYPGLDSWKNALAPTKNNNRHFSNSNDLQAYAINPTLVQDANLFKQQPNCKQSDDDPLKDLCNYVNILRVEQRKLASKNVGTYFQERTRSGYIFQAATNSIPDIIHLGEFFPNAHLVAYLQAEGKVRFNYILGDIHGVRLNSQIKNNLNVLTFFRNTKDGDQQDVTYKEYFTSNWETKNIDGVLTAIIKVPNVFRRQIPTLPRYLTISKVGLYNRIGEYYFEGTNFYGERLAVNQQAMDEIEKAINPDSSVFQ